MFRAYNVPSGCCKPPPFMRGFMTTELHHCWIKHQRHRPCSFRSAVTVRLVGYKPKGIARHQTDFLIKRAYLKTPLQAQEKLFGPHCVGC